MLKYPLHLALALVLGLAPAAWATGEYQDANQIIAGLFPRIRATAAWGGSFLTAPPRARDEYGAILRQVLQLISQSPPASTAKVFQGATQTGLRRFHLLFTDQLVFEYRLPEHDHVYATSPSRGAPINTYFFHRQGITEMNVITGVWINHCFWTPTANGSFGFRSDGFVRTIHALAGALLGYVETGFATEVGQTVTDVAGNYLRSARSLALQKEEEFLEWLRTQPGFANEPTQLAHIDLLLRSLRGESDGLPLTVVENHAHRFRRGSCAADFGIRTDQQN